MRIHLAGCAVVSLVFALCSAKASADPFTIVECCRSAQGIVGVGTSAASTITFDGLTGVNGGPLSAYSEAGFDVSVFSGTWVEAHLFGNPVPEIFSNSASASIRITQQGEGAFNFLGVDLGNSSSIPAFDFPNSFGQFCT